MKKLNFTLFSLALLLVSCSQSPEIFPGKFFGGKEPKGKTVIKDFAGDFDEIKVATGISAELIKADSEKVVLSAPSDIMDQVLVENSGGKLYIHVKPGFRFNTSRIKAKIFTKDFTALEVTSSSSVHSKDTFTQEKTSLSASSGGTVFGNFEANDLRLDASSGSNFSGKIWAVDFKSDISSGSTVEIQGKAKNADISTSSGSTFSGEKVVAESARTDASSGSSISLAVSNKLDAEASSGSSVNIRNAGSLTDISKDENSGGSVNVH